MSDKRKQPARKQMIRLDDLLAPESVQGGAAGKAQVLFGTAPKAKPNQPKKQ